MTDSKKGRKSGERSHAEVNCSLQSYFLQGKRRASIGINRQVHACRKAGEKNNYDPEKKGNADHLCQDHIPSGAIFSILAKVLFYAAVYYAINAFV